MEVLELILGPLYKRRLMKAIFFVDRAGLMEQVRLRASLY